MSCSWSDSRSHDFFLHPRIWRKASWSRYYRLKAMKICDRAINIFTAVGCIACIKQFQFEECFFGVLNLDGSEWSILFIVYRMLFFFDDYEMTVFAVLWSDASPRPAIWTGRGMYLSVSVNLMKPNWSRIPLGIYSTGSSPDSHWARLLMPK